MKTTNNKPIATKVKKHVKRNGLDYYWLERPAFDGSQGCANLDTEFFYPIAFIDQGANKLLKRICNECPFKQACQEYALAHEGHGYWGGTTPPERERIRKTKGWGLIAIEYIGEFFITGSVGRVGKH
jgi:WhiB family redox-sensing transcriptional regulator